MAKKTESHNYSVYVHTVIANGKKYVGITNRKYIEQRWRNGEGYKQQAFYNAIKKYGWDNIKHEILYTGLTREEAIQWEMALIAMWKTTDSNFGYNKTEGGEAYPSSERKLSEQQKQILHERLFGKNNFKARKVINLETLQIYECIADAAREHNLFVSGIHKCCKNEIRHHKHTYWAYYDESFSLDHYSKLYEIIKNKKKKKRVYDDNFMNKQKEIHSKKVICLETLEVFKSSVDAQKKYKCTSVGLCCNHKGYTAGGYHWEFYDENKPLEYYKNLKVRKKPKRKLQYRESHLRKPVIALETLAVYECICDASKATGIQKVNIIKCCREERNKAGGLQWRYYDNTKPMSYYQNLSLNKKHKENPRNRKVLQVETGKIFKTAQEAGRECGTRYGANIIRCCRGKRPTAYGFHWQYAD